MASVRTSVEGVRGCGYRKSGAMYLVSGQLSEPCPKLPIELSVCPCCGAGVKPARGWTWITPEPLLDPGPHGSHEHEAVCPLGTAIDWQAKRAGLIWIGAGFYPTPRDFMREAGAMGVSRRIHNVPRGFVVGETWVALAHAKAVAGECEHGAPVGHVCESCPDGESGGKWMPGVFTFFLPTAVEYIVRGDETEEELDALEARGLSLVRVVRLDEQLDNGAATT